MDFSNKYIIGFSLALCLVCSLAVSAAADQLKELQDANILQDTQVQILRLTGLIGENEKPNTEETNKLFQEKIIIHEVETETGTILGQGEFKPNEFIKAFKGGMPKTFNVLEVPKDGSFVFLVWGKGLWGPMYAYIHIGADKNTVKGLKFYAHIETPGLGAEVDSDYFREQWPGKKLFDPSDPEKNIVIDVTKKGKVTTPEYEVDGITGATITSVAVGDLLQKWFSKERYGNFLAMEVNR